MAVTSILALLALLPLASAGPFIGRNLNTTYYPYALHLPDRTTRNLPPIEGPPPAVLFLTGSGARGSADNVTYLAGYDGIGRRIRFYNSGLHNDTADQLAAEELLTIIPISPDFIPQNQGPTWNVSYFPAILDAVYAEFPFDKQRLYIAGYSMGGRGGWDFILAEPNTFAAYAGASGSSGAPASTLKVVQHMPIHQYIGGDDEAGPIAETTQTQQYMDSLGPNNLTTITLPGEDHIQMSDIPWDENLLWWMLNQTNYNAAAGTATTVNPNGTSSNTSSASASPSASTHSTGAAASELNSRAIVQILTASAIIAVASSWL